MEDMVLEVEGKKGPPLCLTRVSGHVCGWCGIPGVPPACLLPGKQSFSSCWLESTLRPALVLPHKETYLLCYKCFVGKRSKGGSRLLYSSGCRFR